MDSSASSNPITPIERAYREASEPKPSQPVRKPTQPASIHLEWADVVAILQNKRSASPEELQYIIDRANVLHLTARHRNELSVRLTVAIASRDQPPLNPHAALFAELDVAETPVGLLHHRSWFDREMQNAAQAIAACPRHTPPRCNCWREARARLWFVQDRYGPKSPEAFTATRIYETLEEMELASRPERALVVAPTRLSANLSGVTQSG